MSRQSQAFRDAPVFIAIRLETIVTLAAIAAWLAVALELGRL